MLPTLEQRYRDARASVYASRASGRTIGVTLSAALVVLVLGFSSCSHAQEPAPTSSDAPSQLSACAQKVTEEAYDAIRQRARADVAEQRAAAAEARLKALLTSPTKENKK